MCNHDIALLVGSAEGIFCKGCGKTFKSFAEITNAPVEEKPKRSTRKKKEPAVND